MVSIFMETKEITQVNTKSKILSHAANLFAIRGYFGVSMEDIANSVGVGKSALYYYFDSKETILRILITKSCDELKVELKGALDKSVLPSDYIFNIVLTLLNFRVKHPEITMLTTLGFSSDERIPALQFVVDQRQKLIKFIRVLLIGTNVFRVFSYTLLQTIIIQILGFVFNPLINLNSDHKKTARAFSSLVKVN
jgi:AcrR family transcriptional regulator